METFVDTHCHLYLQEFDHDREEIIEQAKAVGVRALLLPNVDTQTIDPMLELANRHTNYCHPMMGLHPTSVDQDYKKRLATIEKQLSQRTYIAIGEIGLDLYWEKRFLKEQIDAFNIQLKWAEELNLPVSVHVREAFEQIREIFKTKENKNTKGVFHCFSGSDNDARWVIEQTHLYVGVTGNVTYKKSPLPQILPIVPLSKILIETDAPYLSPQPYRGKRNHPAYLQEVINTLSEIYQTDSKTIKLTTETNTNRLFSI